MLTDLDQERLDKGVAYVHGEVDKLLGKGRVSADEANRLKGLVTGSLTKDAFADADFVIEAVFEEMGVKQKVFAEVEAVVSPECVLATNTSSLSVTEMAAEAAAPRAGRRLPLLQPGRGAAAAGDRPGRADRRRDARHRLRHRQGAEEVVRAGQGRPGVRGQPRRCCGCSARSSQAVDEGTPTRRRRPRGRAAGPADAAVRAAGAGRPGDRAARRRDAARGVPGPLRVSGKLAKLVAAGKTGRLPRRTSPSTRRPWRSSAGGTSPSTEEQVLDRALDALAEEIRLMLDEGVVAGARGHRPVHDPRRRLAVPPGRRHAVPRPHRRRGAGERLPLPHPGRGEPAVTLERRPSYGRAPRVRVCR